MQLQTVQTGVRAPATRAQSREYTIYLGDGLYITGFCHLGTGSGKGNKSVATGPRSQALELSREQAVEVCHTARYLGLTAWINSAGGLPN